MSEQSDERDADNPTCRCGHAPEQHDPEAVPALCMICGDALRCTDVGALTEILDRTLAYSQGGLITGRSMAQAEAILSSDWLAAYVARADRGGDR